MEYTTKDLSRLLDVSTNTIRRYESKGYLSADRNEQNGYRIFSNTDVEKLMYVAKYRKVGFSHEDISELLLEDREHITERFRRKKEEIDKEIMRLKALSHLLKDDIMLMNRVEEYGEDIIEMECSPLQYVLYRKRGELCTSDKQEAVLHHFMSTCMEFEYMYLFEQADVQSKRLQYSEGVGANRHRALKYGVNIEPPVELYEKRPCLLRFMRIPLNFKEEADEAPEVMFQYLFGGFQAYMEEHALTICGDAMALKLGYSKEEGKAWQYILMHLPVMPKE